MMRSMIEAEEHSSEDTIALWIYLVVCIVSGGMVVLGHFVEAATNEFTKMLSGWSVHIFMKELGFAGIISLILIFTIERFTRKRHERAADELVKRINDDLFHVIYERYIPSKLFSEVEKALMESNVYRRNHEVNYTLDNLDESERFGGLPCDRHVKCSVIAMYDLENISDHLVEHNVVLNLERPIDPEWEKMCRVTAVEIDGKPLSQEEIVKGTGLTPAQIKFSHKVTLKPRETVPVLTKATLIKRKLDQEVWSSRLPSDGIKLVVTVPAKDLEVQAHAHHHEELKQLVDTGVSRTWVLQYGMFPHQSVVFWWRQKQPIACPKV